jgi:hypothetical protein
MNNYTFEELIILGRYHFKYYRSYLKKKNFNQLKSITLECAYAYSIQSSIEQLTHDERRILMSEYIDCVEKNWWMEYFSKTSYYRIKRRALSRFIHCLHNEIVV